MSRRLGLVIVPALALGVFVAYLAIQAWAPWRVTAGAFDLRAFGRLPVSVSGRVQPIDSVARLGFLQIHGAGSLPVEGARPGMARVLESTEWLLEILAKPDAADTRRIFTVRESELARKLSLKGRERGTPNYAFEDFAGQVPEIGRQVQRVASLKAADRAAWERELLLLHDRLVLYERLKNSVQPNSLLQRDAKSRPAFEFGPRLARYRGDMAEAVAVARRRREGSRDVLNAGTEQRLRDFSQLFQPVSRLALIGTIPPAEQRADRRERWRNTGAAILDGARGEPLSPAVTYVAALTSAYANGDAARFNEVVHRYEQWLSANGLASAVRLARHEAFYNGFRPMLEAIAVYGIGLVLLVLAWRTGSGIAYRSAVLLILLAFAVHTLGLALVIELAGRPSFAASAGWTVALAALVTERFRRYVGAAAAAVAALAVLVAGQALGPAGPAVILGEVANAMPIIVAMAAAVALAVLARSIAPSRARFPTRWSSSQEVRRRSVQTD